MSGAPSGFRRLHDGAVGLTGWRRRGLAVGLGVLAAGALPPLHIVIFLVPAFAGLIWLIASRPNLRGALADGWWFGAGHAAAGTFWISHSLTIDLARHGWLIPIAVVGFAAVLGLFPALAAGILHRLRRTGAAPGGGDALILAAAWTISEWVQGWLFTGFPWNLMGTVWTFADAMVQPASAVGIYGLSLFTVWAASAPAALASGGRRPWLASAFAAAFLAGVWGGGMWRLAGAETAFAPGVHLRLVQPNIAQADKWRSGLRAGHVARQIEMSLNPGGVDGVPQPSPEQGDEPKPDPAPEPTHIIWAETAVPYVLGREPVLLRALSHAAPIKGALLTGSLRIEDRSDGPPRVYNSLYAVEASGRVALTYDKHHLVPFGEYVPFQDWLGFLKITQGRGNFTPGPGPRVLEVKGLPPFSPLICYEVIFPHAVLPRPGETLEEPRARWLLNLTNDAWFGVTPGPYQHLAAARLRSVEEGLPLVRVANTGISAIIDPWGRTVTALGLGEAGAIDAGLPEPIEARTLFSRIGNTLALVLAGLFAAFGYLAHRRTDTDESPSRA
ncbi:MAG: apolipoprotein N-acyltransferase [Rhodospirillaceae bacterium]|nr:apolipoprotein N-acyltransferase [Rhodospirillaceae bacterium]